MTSSDKAGLIQALNECAVLMELAGENPFRCRAFAQGARTLETLEGTPEQWLETGVLEETRGIGKGMIEKVQEWVGQGRLELLEELHEQVPAGLMEMMKIPTLGPKKIKMLWKERGIDSLHRLEEAIQAGELAGLAGLGPRSIEKIRAGIEQRRKYSDRHRLDAAGEAGEAILGRLRRLDCVGRVEVAGSLRRSRETIKDIDVVATSSDPGAVMKAFVEMPGVEAVVAHGETKSSVLLEGGLPVDLRVVQREEFAAALNYFTGSKDHNTQLRGRARKLGYKLNEYGLFREGEGAEADGAGAGAEPGGAIELTDENALYERLGLRYIAPELREGLGEIEAAEKDELPELVGTAHVAGVLHCHTTYSDGKTSVLELAQACMDAGYSYLAICDHSRSAAYAGGLSIEELERQGEEIARVNEKLKNFRIFKGVESDILADGSLDYPDEVLAKLELVVVSIHSRMTMDRETMTRRICRALEHPATNILAHPTGRLLLRREPYAVDLDRVFETAAAHRVAIEINAHPSRLDLDWTQMRRARAAGCVFAINPDAHDVGGIEHIKYGVSVARKGWLGPKDVINTMSAHAFEQWLAQKRQPV